MRHVLFVLLVSLTATAFPALAQTAGAPVEVRLTGSRLLGLLDFAVSAAGSSEAVPTLRRLIENSDTDPVETEAVRQLAEIDLGAYNYAYVGYPSTHGQTMGAWALFRMAAAKSSDWDDLRDRTAGLYPNDVQSTILQAMRDVEPAYNALLWDLYGSAFQRQTDSLRTYLGNSNFNSVVQHLAPFYGSDWPANLPLWIALYPFPPQRGFSAGVAGNVILSRIAPDFDRYDVYASVALHELSHQLFTQQPPALAHSIRNTMMGTAFPTRMLAYRWLDEALATATSNGWAYRQFTGSLDTTSWYDNRIIEGYARALYPRVEAYLEAGRGIDDDFLRFAAARFEATFPGAMEDPEALFPFFSLVTDADGGRLNTLLAPLYERYRLRGTSATNNFSDASLEAALGTPALTIVLLTKPDAEKTALLRRHLPSSLLEVPQDGVFALTSRGHPVLLLRLDSPGALRQVLDRVDAEGVMPLAKR